MGVTLFRLDDDERVTSVFPVLEQEPDTDGAPDAGADEPDADPHTS
jgi:hypothetical protein